MDIEIIVDNLDESTIANLHSTTYNAHSVFNREEYTTMLHYKDIPVHIILTYSYAGFWSIFNKLMNYLAYYPNVQRISYSVFSSENTFYGNSNIFDVFLPYGEGDSIHKVYANNYITYELTGCFANWIHVTKDTWRMKYNELFTKYIQISPSIQLDLESYSIPKDKTILSILIRHPELSHEQINGRMPSLDQYDTAIDSLLEIHKDCFFIFATDVEEAYAHFVKKYGHFGYIHPHSSKTSCLQAPPIMKSSGSVDHSRIALLTVLLLARGHHFIFPNSNMATAALYINPKMKSHYLIG